MSTGGRWHVVVVAWRVVFSSKTCRTSPNWKGSRHTQESPWLPFWRAGESNVWKASGVVSPPPTHAHECSPGDIAGICHLRKAAFPSCPQNHENSPLRFWPLTVSSPELFCAEHRISLLLSWRYAKQTELPQIFFKQFVDLFFPDILEAEAAPAAGCAAVSFSSSDSTEIIVPVGVVAAGSTGWSFPPSSSIVTTKKCFSPSRNSESGVKNKADNTQQLGWRGHYVVPW